ncbi:MAG: glycosyltransferase [Balneola sp.]|nr:MAG: glycosyltransferase [Balneola sp.]
MKSVLFILYYFPPMGGSGVQRPLKFIKYLREFGWNPIVICPEPGAYHSFDESLQKELDEMEIEIHRVRGNTPLHRTGKRKLVFPTWLESFLRKISLFFWLPDNKKGWINEGYKKAQQLLRKGDIDLIFASAPPYSNLMLADKLKRIFDIPLIMDFRDDWLNSHFINYPSRFHYSRMRSLESKTIENADCLITINKYIADSLSSRCSTRIEIIPQGFDSEDFSVLPKLNSDPKKISFLYSGTFYVQSGPGIFLEAMSRFIEENPKYSSVIELHFQGFLSERDRKLIEAKGLSDVTVYYGQVNHKEAVKNLLIADVLWMNNNHKKRPEAISFGKTYEYMASKKPVLALLPEGDAKETLKNYGKAFISNPESVNDVYSNIEKVIKHLEEETMPQTNDEFVLKFDRKVLTAQLAELFNEISK